MAKKNANAVELTPDELTKKLANEYAQLVFQKKEIEKKADQIKADLVQHSKDNPFFDYEALSIIPSAPKPIIDFGSLTKKGQEHLLAKLILDLPDFVINTATLDIERISIAATSNPNVSNALKANGVKLAQSTTYTIRINK